MSSLLERLLVAATVMATPLLAVAATTKKTTRSKTQTKRPKPKAAPVRRAKKEAAPAGAARGKTPTRPKLTRRGAPVRPKQPEPPPAKTPARRPEPTGPVPKPVAPTGRALLLLPENGKYADSLYPKFRWLSVGGATRYEVEWSEHPDLSGAYSVVSLATEAAVPVEKPLRVGATFYWRVRGGNEGGWGPWSIPSSFQVLEEPPAA
jgi:hypothetical protein